MTQALNLANFANTLNSSGQASNSGLQNASVTVTAGTGLSGGGAVSLGSSVTLTNAGVTSLTAGTGISVSASTGGVTITNTATQGAIKAWVDYNATIQTISQSYNVSSITYHSTGDYTVNFTNSLANTGYVIHGSGVGLSGTSFYGIVCLNYVTPTKTTSACRVAVFGNVSGSPFSYDSPDLGISFITT